MTYATVLRNAQFSRPFLATTLGRIAQLAFEVALIVYLSQQIGLPTVAGLALLCAVLPGLFLSPFVASFLHGRGLERWLGVDFFVKAATIATIPLIWHLWQSPVGILVACTVSSVTTGCTNVGLRTLIATRLEVPCRGPANGLDACSYAAAGVLGPGLAGGFTSAFSAEGALFIASAIYAAATTLCLTRKGSVLPKRSGLAIAAITESIREIAENQSLRWLTIAYFSYQVAIGMTLVACPVLFASHTVYTSAWTGYCVSAAGVTGVLSSICAGYLIGRWSEQQLLALGATLNTVAVFALTATVSNLLIPMTCFFLMGLAVGPLDVGLLSLRQRLMPEHAAPVFLAISTSVNMAGYPLGAAIAAAMMHMGPFAIVIAATGASAIATFVAAILLNPKRNGTRSTRSLSANRDIGG